MKELTSEIEIEAPPETVWRVLTDFDAYHEWNPIEIEMKGRPVIGTVLEHTSKLPGNRPMKFRPTIMEVEPGRALAWDGRLFLPRLFDVRHQFALEPAGEGRTRLRQSEQFRGMLIPFVGGTLRKTQEAFGIANHAIKERAQTLQRSSAREVQ
jgi:hypothetical protein